MNTGVHVSFRISVFIFSRYTPTSGIADRIVVLSLVFQGTSILFPIVAGPIYIPTNSVQGFPFLHILFPFFLIRISRGLLILPIFLKNQILVLWFSFIDSLLKEDTVDKIKGHCNPFPKPIPLLLSLRYLLSWVSCLPFPFHLYIKVMQASLVVQWLRIHLPMQGTWVRALVREDPTRRGATKPVCHNYWARMPQLLKPACLEPARHNYWSPCA